MRQNRLLLKKSAAKAVGISVFVLMFIVFNSAFAGTDAGFILTNTASLSWGGGSLQVEVYSEVGTNYGGTWIGTNSALVNVIAGNTVVNDAIFTNEGNAPADFFFNYNILASSSSTAWTALLTNKEAAGLGGSNITVSGITPGGIKTVSLIVSIPSGETNNASNVFLCIASNAQATIQGAVQYTGSNGTVYGGTMGMNGAAPGNVFMSMGAFTNWTVKCQSATMQLARTFSFTNPAPYIGLSYPVPGSLITLKLAYTNAGGSAANNLTIVDTVNTNKLGFFAGSLKKGAYSDSYSAAGGLTSANNDDEGAYFGDNKVYFSPSGSATNTTGNVGAGGNGSYFYQLTLN